MEAVGHGEFGSIYRQDDRTTREKTLTVLPDTQRNQGACQRASSRSMIGEWLFPTRRDLPGQT